MDQKGLTFSHAPGATPLSLDEMAGLIPDYISTQGELNQLERNNIVEARLWADKKKRDVLDVGFLMKLHRKMFGRVWKWAGKTRTSDKSIGVFWQQIHSQLVQLVKNTAYQIDKGEEWDQLGVRFHHRLVWVHPFPNGNGRHARLATDLLMSFNERLPFSWGFKSSSSSLDVEGGVRKEYILALQEADQGSYARLIHFAKS